MKKLISISVVFVLLASAVFAEVTWSGTVGVTADLAKSSTKKELKDDGTPLVPASYYWYEQDKDLKVGGSYWRLRLQAEGQNDDGTFGGRLRINGGSGFDPSGFAWWKPLSMLKIQLGANPDGEFGADGISGWDFLNDALDNGVTGSVYNPKLLRNLKVGLAALGADPNDFPDTNMNDYVFYGGFGDYGALLSITPIEALAINLVVPYKEDYANWVYKRFHAQAAYTMEGLGKFVLTYKGGAGDKEEEYDNPADYISVGLTQPATGEYYTVKKLRDEIHEPGALFAYFSLTMIENLGLDLGIGYTFASKIENHGSYVGLLLDETKVSYPLGVGIGATYDLGTFGVKARVSTTFMGKITNTQYTAGVKAVETEVTLPLMLGFELLPYYAINDTFKVFLSFSGVFTGKTEMTMTAPGSPYEQKNTVNSTFDIAVNPYIEKKVGNGAFYAGFKFQTFAKITTDESSNVPGYVAPVQYTLVPAYINWSIPIGMVYSF